MKGSEKKLRGFLKNLTPWKEEFNMTCMQEKAVKLGLMVTDNAVHFWQKKTRGNIYLTLFIAVGGTEVLIIF